MSDRQAMQGDFRYAVAEPARQLEVRLLGVSRIAVGGREVEEAL